MGAPHVSQAVMDAATDMAWGAGIRVLQGCRLAPGDAAHVDALLRFMDPPMDATLLDVGCGFGEVARLMRETRPDLDFVLVNKNAKQLSRAPAAFRRVRTDMHELPFATASVDGVMFFYALCHADFLPALSEAARVTRADGGLFVYDYDRTGGDNDLFEQRLAARAIPFTIMRIIAEVSGWVFESHETVTGDDALFRHAYANDAEYDAIFDHLTLALWKMRRAHD